VKGADAGLRVHLQDPVDITFVDTVGLPLLVLGTLVLDRRDERPPGEQHGAGGFARYGSAEKVALNLITLQMTKMFELSFSLDTFGDDAQA
jgi:hypothetical protein